MQRNLGVHGRPRGALFSSRVKCGHYELAFGKRRYLCERDKTAKKAGSYWAIGESACRATKKNRYEKKRGQADIKKLN